MLRCYNYKIYFALLRFAGDTTAANLSVIKKVASNSNLPTEISRKVTEGQEKHVEKFAIIIHHANDYLLNADSQLVGDRLQHIQQLETLGYTVVSINPSSWNAMALSSNEEKASFLKHHLGLINCDISLKQNFSFFRQDIL